MTPSLSLESGEQSQGQGPLAVSQPYAAHLCLVPAGR